MGSSAGLLIATGLFTAMSSLPEEQFLAWGWRVPFLLSIVLVVVGLVIRLKIAETPAFQQMKETGTEARMPIVDAVRTYPKSILLVMGMRVAENACGYIFTVFVLFYVTEELGLPNSAAYAGVMIAAGVQFLITPVYGAISDRVGRRPVYMWGAGFLVLFAFPFFWLLNTETPILIRLAIVLAFAVGNGAMFATQPAFFSELFGTNVRYSGVSLGYQMSAVFAGGLALHRLRAARLGGRVLACCPLRDGGGPHQLRLGLSSHGVVPGRPHQGAHKRARGDSERSGPDYLASLRARSTKEDP